MLEKIIGFIFADRCLIITRRKFFEIWKASPVINRTNKLYEYINTLYNDSNNQPGSKKALTKIIPQMSAKMKYRWEKASKRTDTFLKKYLLYVACR